jgi:hypothetical protein
VGLPFSLVDTPLRYRPFRQQSWGRRHISCMSCRTRLYLEYLPADDTCSAVRCSIVLR